MIDYACEPVEISRNFHQWYLLWCYDISSYCRWAETRNKKSGCNSSVPLSIFYKNMVWWRENDSLYSRCSNVSFKQKWSCKMKWPINSRRSFGRGSSNIVTLFIRFNLECRSCWTSIFSCVRFIWANERLLNFPCDKSNFSDDLQRPRFLPLYPRYSHLGFQNFEKREIYRYE